MSAVVLIPQLCFSVISSVLLQTLISYQSLIPVQSLDLVLLPLAPACAEGDTGCHARAVLPLHSCPQGLTFPCHMCKR